MKFSSTLAASTVAFLLQLQLTSASLTDCTSGYVSDYSYFTTCYNSAGDAVDSAINLDKCVANDGGQLTCAHNGYFSSTCSGCEIAAGIEFMECYCGDGHGGEPASIVDLGDCVTIKNGILTC
ncbi:hypothetical protein GLOTRDRAFT_134059 [Gloeophyllum trabeum ATCC 11539]|uniref:Cyanovirin-N domain-containing protein n=1 Tax=Gloeophyllum trabeum (strain ATCC 11539 / FP-39264 / Madison 617) TaxID=670483 RepID=S7PSC8_GLOTA|nr:uncharacterized protein GLOTRDRAFT_134059 [Gloeophyllum trabeum ATCC 11539]EPQ50318.1 hypothetical protein GLOTRDRAFT_134059 [Gloeophyllum trabeum ATCC 11539]